MCLATVGQVLSVDGEHGTAVVASGRRRMEVSLAPIVLDDRAVVVGDWLLIHTGLAVTLLDREAALEILDATATLLPPGGPEP
jgi:hydrogenase expression/formation protein HypC